MPANTVSYSDEPAGSLGQWPLGPGALGGIRRWHDLYDSESGWPEWALGQAELPSIAEIIS